MSIKTNELNISKAEFIAILTLLSVVTAFSTDFILPAFGAIRQTFDIPPTSNVTAQLISIFFAGMAVSQLFFGVLADRFGRKPLLYLALGIYVSASFVAIFSPTFFILLATRFVQGIGAGACRVLSQAIIRDYFKGESMAKLMSILMAFFILFPIIAPPLGALLILFLPWQSFFIFFIAFATINLVWTHFRIKESLATSDRRMLRISTIFDGFRQVVTNRQSIICILIVGMTFSGFCAYLGTAQLIYEEIYGVSIALWFSISAAVMGCAFVSNNRLIDHFGLPRLTRMFICWTVVFSAMLLTVSLWYAGTPPFWMFISLFSLMGFSVCIVFPNANAMAMEPMGRLAGTAAAIIGFLTTLIGAGLGQYISSHISTDILPFALGWFLANALALLSISFLSPKVAAVPHGN